MAYGCPICRAVFRSEFARCPRDGAALGELADDPLIGETIGDRYVIADLVGEGAMGRVYRARHKRVSRQFAVKVLFGDHAADPKMRARFTREAEAASRMAHPNVVGVLDFGETETGLLYLAMDYVEGESLSREISANGALGDERTATLVRQLASGLAHAHEQGLVHRDFKGENVILTRGVEGEVPKIVDFGIAVLADPEDRGNRLTTQGMVVGTPAYMAPEQATGEAVDARSDLFSLGVLMYEMLAGVLPFTGTPMTVARQNLSVDPPPIAVRVPGLAVSPKLEAIAFRLMEKVPEDRYQHALEVIDAIDDAIEHMSDGAPVVLQSAFSSADTQDTWQLDTDAGGRRKAWIWGIAVAAGMGIGALALASPFSGGDAPVSETRVAVTKPETTAAVDGLEAVAPSPTATLSATEPVVPAPSVAGEPQAHEKAAGEEATAAAGEAATAAAGEEAEARDRPSVREKARGAAKRKAHARARHERRRSHRTRRGDTGASQSGPDLDTLTRRYVAVGRAIDRLAGKRGSAAASPLRREYFAIPYQDALRDPALRKQAYRKLRALGRKVHRALER